LSIWYAQQNKYDTLNYSSNREEQRWSPGVCAGWGGEDRATGSTEPGVGLVVGVTLATNNVGGRRRRLQHGQHMQD